MKQLVFIVMFETQHNENKTWLKCNAKCRACAVRKCRCRFVVVFAAAAADDDVNKA